MRWLIFIKRLSIAKISEIHIGKIANDIRLSIAIYTKIANDKRLSIATPLLLSFIIVVVVVGGGGGGGGGVCRCHYHNYY